MTLNPLTVQNWNLDSLYEGGTRSIKLKQLINGLAENLHILVIDLEAQEPKLKNQEFRTLLNIMDRFQSVLIEWQELDEFVTCLHSENVKDTTVLTLMDKSAELKAIMDTVKIDLHHLLAAMQEDTWNEFINLEAVKPISFYLNKERQAIKDRLPKEMEKLISDLSVNGIKGWEQQQQLMLSKLRVSIELDGIETEVSIGQAMNYAIHSKNPGLRKLAAQGINNTCEAEADSFASILNRIAGSRLDVYEQRGWPNILKEAVEQNDLNEATIDAVLASISQNKDLYQAYIQRKVKLTGSGETSWFDLASPIFASAEKVSYAEAKSIIIKQFNRFSSKLGSFAEKVFAEGWVEMENRADKAEGGFCASMPLAGESRIFFTYRETYQDVVTLAHEIGHAYHNFILQGEPALAQQKGTSIDETASTFMENLVLDAVINQTTNEQEKLALLEMKIKNGLMYVGTVPNMFLFEQKFYRKRKEGLVTVDEIQFLLSEVEHAFYEGEIENLGLYKWMYISHFYDAEIPFYNIPYTIGYLFSSGIYEMARAEPNGFAERYDSLLRDSGRMTVEQLAQTFLDADISTSEFWNTSQQSLREAIEEYLRLTEKY